MSVIPLHFIETGRRRRRRQRGRRGSGGGQNGWGMVGEREQEAFKLRLRISGLLCVADSDFVLEAMVGFPWRGVGKLS